MTTPAALHALYSRSVKGDGAAFARLFARWEPGLRAIAARRARDLGGDDLIASTRERCLIGIRKHTGGVAKFGAWVRSVANNVVNDHIRELRGRQRPQRPHQRATRLPPALQAAFLEEWRRLVEADEDVPVLGPGPSRTVRDVTPGASAELARAAWLFWREAAADSGTRERVKNCAALARDLRALLRGVRGLNDWADAITLERSYVAEDAMAALAAQLDVKAGELASSMLHGQRPEIDGASRATAERGDLLATYLMQNGIEAPNVRAALKELGQVLTPAGVRKRVSRFRHLPKV